MRRVTAGGGDCDATADDLREVGAGGFEDCTESGLVGEDMVCGTEVEGVRGVKGVCVESAGE